MASASVAAAAAAAAAKGLQYSDTSECLNVYPSVSVDHLGFDPK